MTKDDGAVMSASTNGGGPPNGPPALTGKVRTAKVVRITEDDQNVRAHISEGLVGPGLAKPKSSQPDQLCASC